MLTLVLLGATLSSSTPAASPARTPIATPQPSPIGTTARAPGALTGQWLFGSTHEPPRGPTTMEPPCFGGAPNVMRIAQDGDRVTIDYSVPQPAHGAVYVYEPYAGEHSTGTFDGERLLASGSFNTGYAENGSGLRLNPEATPPPDRSTQQPVAYELRLDARSGHLVGTRNAQTFWAVRVTMTSRKTPCPPPPP